MAERVFLHIGLPKTATTYLQRLMWQGQAQMRDQGVLLPGEARREHLWASRVVRGEDRAEAMTPWQRGAWDRLRAEIAAWEGHAVVSHEFFAAATAEQAREMVEALAPAEVHLVVTAREPLGLFTASWQESLKNRETTPMAEYGREVSESPSDIWNWRTLDLSLVLDRWAPEDGLLAAERVHVLPLPGRDAPREEIWHRFAIVLGLDSGAFDLSGTFPNESMGVVEAETLRRVNDHLGSFTRAIDRGTFIRTFLADERLVPRQGERFWPGERQIQECRSRGKDAVELVQKRGFSVVGDPADLLVPDELPRRRQPDSVTDTEVSQVSVELVATMLEDYRAVRHERRQLRQDAEDATEALADYRRLPLYRIAGSRVKGWLRRRGLLRA